MSKFDEVLSRRSKQASSKAVPKGSRETVPTRAPGKSADPDYQKTTIYLRKMLHRDVKIACLKTDPPRDLSGVIEQQLAAWLKKQRRLKS